MSKIGKRPIPLPAGVRVVVEDGRVVVEGPHGRLEQPYEPHYVEINVGGDAVHVKRRGERAAFRARHGLYRALIANMVRGVSERWERHLEIQGLGYRARMEGTTLVMELGYSHPIRYQPPAGVEVEAPDQQKIVVRGVDRQRVGQVAADIRKFRPPEPYRGTGVRYRGEEIVRKAGKLGVK
ncbi:MAG: 50S ribosomal protein L6 [Candidatus Bipolaricaulaceae bacterium]